jgi:hypothetical protein
MCSPMIEATFRLVPTGTVDFVTITVNRFDPAACLASARAACSTAA